MCVCVCLLISLCMSSHPAWSFWLLFPTLLHDSQRQLCSCTRTEQGAHSMLSDTPLCHNRTPLHSTVAEPWELNAGRTLSGTAPDIWQLACNVVVGECVYIQDLQQLDKYQGPPSLVYRARPISLIRWKFGAEQWQSERARV